MFDSFLGFLDFLKNEYINCASRFHHDFWLVFKKFIIETLENFQKSKFENRNLHWLEYGQFPKKENLQMVDFG